MQLSKCHSNIYDALNLHLIIEKFHGLSPMARFGNRLVSSPTSYLYIMIGFYIILSATFLLQMPDDLQTFFLSNGYLFCVIVASDHFLNKVSFLFTISLSQLKKEKKIQFYCKINEIDVILNTKFGKNVDYRVLKLSLLPLIFLWLIIVFFVLSTAVSFSKHHILNSYTMQILMCMFYFESTVYLLICSGYVNCVMLIRSSFRVLKSVLLDMQNQNGGKSFQLSTEMDLVVVIYKEMISLIEVVNDNLGILVFTRIISDSVVGSAMGFMLLGMFLEGNTAWTPLIKGGMWLVHNLLKMLLVTWSADMCMNEVAINWLSNRVFVTYFHI